MTDLPLLRRFSASALGLAVLLASVSLLPACEREKRLQPLDPIFAYADDGQYLERRAGPGLIDAPESPIPDVPLPLGFVGQASQSLSSNTGVSRSVDHTYQGRALLQDLAVFYRYRLWQNDWRTTSADGADDRLVITAVKGAERLVIDARAKFDIVTMRITIGPGA